MSRFQFVADHCATFEVKRLCELVEIERSSYYAWVKAGPAREERARADAELAERIRAVHQGDKTYGAPDHCRAQRRGRAAGAGQPQAGRPRDAAQHDRWLRQEAAGAHDGP
ncbi:hypothetical protein GCM10025862_03990 [Arsenicicoccus piscis]|uniref:HTH-like domain-containing protein n=1 Tax=Arsenicicoccus piscis TaxID=673954 RepID=A0ABQ6HJY6_9MICO|nr:hypothetical protein GCM10025862_03990 [Arsenicicoccus piscis]